MQSHDVYGFTLNSTYDDAGRAIQESDSKGGLTNRTVDAANRLVSQATTVNGQHLVRVDWTYTNRNEVASEARYKEDTGYYNLVGFSNYLYDPAGR